ncbi:MAG: hypothetical protein ABIG11_11100 [bacterium]
MKHSILSIKSSAAIIGIFLAVPVACQAAGSGLSFDQGLDIKSMVQELAENYDGNIVPPLAAAQYDRESSSTGHLRNAMAKVMEGFQYLSGPRRPLPSSHPILQFSNMAGFVEDDFNTYFEDFNDPGEKGDFEWSLNSTLKLKRRFLPDQSRECFRAIGGAVYFCGDSAIGKEEVSCEEGDALLVFDLQRYNGGITIETIPAITVIPKSTKEMDVTYTVTTVYPADRDIKDGATISVKFKVKVRRFNDEEEAFRDYYQRRYK